MRSADVLSDAFGRIREVVDDVVDGLTPDELSLRVDDEANTIAWLVWHLTRIQDDHVARAADLEQVWTSAGWSARFDLPFDRADTGYGHDRNQVAVVASNAETLRGYHDAVYQATLRFVDGLNDADLDRVVDTRWDPPVTLGVRLVSVVSDDLQHVGQAAFIRGILGRS
ncbi:MAG TPA: DUF664 domain-containing protein [Acidimicrobiales bacterium]|nr:DUF664 domain-containing protein [Acidimicrobiales bacterium]